MRTESKYAVSNLEISIDIMERINSAKPNVVTINSLFNILKGRAKRGDADALKYMATYADLKILYVGNSELISKDEIIEKYNSIFEEYMSIEDRKDRDLCTAFEDFEKEYFYTIQMQPKDQRNV